MHHLSLTPLQAVTELTARARILASGHPGRIAIGLAGGPGAGKSTIAAEVVAALNATQPGLAALVPMDGFHMRHAKLEQLGLVADKGAAHTFEGAAFAQFLADLKAAQGPISGPGYSREIEDVVEDAFTVPAETGILIVEGNYLLLPDAPWDAVKPLLELAVFVEVPRDIVAARLLKRHAEAGLFTEERNRAHIERVDLPNYDAIALTKPYADVAITISTPS